MVSAFEIRSRLADWLDGRISFREFEDWFVPSTWDIHLGGDPVAQSLVADIDLEIAEYTGGYKSLAEMANAVRPFVVGTEVVPKSSSEISRIGPAMASDLVSWFSGRVQTVLRSGHAERGCRPRQSLSSKLQLG